MPVNVGTPNPQLPKRVKMRKKLVEMWDKVESEIRKKIKTELPVCDALGISERNNFYDILYDAYDSIVLEIKK